MVSIQRVYQWTPSADNDNSISFLEFNSGLFGFKFRRRWNELEQSVATFRSSNCRSRLGVPETSNSNSYNVTSPTPSVTSSVAVDALRVSGLCNLAAGCTGKRRFALVEKRRRKSRPSRKFDGEDVSRARTKSLPLPKRQCVISSRSEDSESRVKLSRQLTPSAQRSRRVLCKDKVRKSRGMKSGLQITKNGTDAIKHLQKPIIIHRRAASMESIQKVFDFYDEEDASNEDEEHKHQELKGSTFQLIDIVEPSEVFGDYCNGADQEMEHRKSLLIRNISPSLAVPLEDDQSKGCNCEAINESKPKLMSPELVKLAKTRSRQNNVILRQDRDEDSRKSSQSFGDQPDPSARHRSVSVLSCTSRSEPCSFLLRPEEFPGLPSDTIRSCVCHETLKSVSPPNQAGMCLPVCLSDLLNSVAYSAESSLSRYSDSLRAGRSGDRIPVGFSAPVQTGPGAHPASCAMGNGPFPGVKRPGRGADHPPPPKRRGHERVGL